jgi:hypothetical protein
MPRAVIILEYTAAGPDCQTPADQAMEEIILTSMPSKAYVKKRSGKTSAVSWMTSLERND